MRIRFLLAVLVLALAAGPVAAAPKGRPVVALGSDTSTQDPHLHTERVGIIINTAKEMDQWLEEARATVDPKKRQEIAYGVPMYAQYTIEAVSTKLTDEASTDEIMRVYAATWKA